MPSTLTTSCQMSADPQSEGVTVMPSERVVVISDVHLDQWPDDLPGEHQAKRRAFLDFLDWVSQMGREDRVGRFVIVGDLIDVPQKDHRPLLPTYDDVYAGLQKVISAGVKLGYVIGNHDAGLVGLNLDLQRLGVRIGYPYLVVRTDDSQFAVEHGHLYDPWLWDYVRHLGAAMWTGSAGAHGPGVLRAAPNGQRQASSGADVDPAARVATLLQTSLRAADLSDAEFERLRDALLDDLEDDYGDVTDRNADGQMLGNRDALREQLQGRRASPAPGLSLAASGAGVQPLAQSVEGLVMACYSGPHWRRAAKNRLPAMAQEAGGPLAGIVMGHTHYADQFTWDDGTGQSKWYANSGSWRHDSADVVIVEGQTFRVLRRNWEEPLPRL